MTYGSLGVIESAVSRSDGPSDRSPVLTTLSARRATCMRDNTAEAAIGDGLPPGEANRRIEVPDAAITWGRILRERTLRGPARGITEAVRCATVRGVVEPNTAGHTWQRRRLETYASHRLYDLPMSRSTNPQHALRTYDRYYNMSTAAGALLAGSRIT